MAFRKHLFSEDPFSLLCLMVMSAAKLQKQRWYNYLPHLNLWKVTCTSAHTDAIWASDTVLYSVLLFLPSMFWFLQQRVYEVKLEDGNVYVKHASRLSLQPFPVEEKSWTDSAITTLHCSESTQAIFTTCSTNPSHLKHFQALSDIFTDHFHFDCCEFRLISGCLQRTWQY